ncbi:MAG: histidine kinase [Pseudoflavonifractor sp.]|nr:histidine kinase [Pseudoflavonifractor sp.]
MRTTISKYLLLTVAFMFLSSGVLVAGFLDVYDSVGYSIFWLLLPMTLLFISAVVVNDRILIPRLLLNNRYVYYCIGVFSMVYALSFISLCLEYATRRCLDLPMRISDYSSPWILADILGNSLLLAMILLGLGLLHLFNRWKAEADEEKALSERLVSYINTVNDRLNFSVILDKLRGISEKVHDSPEETANRIRRLSNYLREQLYELPEPPVVGAAEPRVTGYSRLTDCLVSRRYRPVRHILFLAVLAIISCGVFFNAPDSPEFTLDRFVGMLSMFGVLAFIAYVNILWLYPRFMKRGSMKRYPISVAILLLAIVVPMIVVQILTYEPNVYSKPVPVVIAVISTVGSVLTLFLFVGGISSVLMLQNWVQTSHRMTLLRAESVRQEYAWLRKQINPHFLFNVLNNIGICAYDDPDLTATLLTDLQHLLKYQLLDLRREYTTLKVECAFISSYFALECTRRNKFDYRLVCDGPDNIRIPTLLFIPFVENAVKYSSSSACLPDVEVRFRSADGRLTFECRNHYNPSKIKDVKQGGLGLENTLKRLKYLYDDNFYYNYLDVDGTYSVKLIIPLT